MMDGSLQLFGVWLSLQRYQPLSTSTKRIKDSHMVMIQSIWFGGYRFLVCQ